MPVFIDRPIDDLSWFGEDMPKDVQVPRHTVTATLDGDEMLLEFDCPFGNDTYLSVYPTVEEFWQPSGVEQEGVNGHPQHVGHVTLGYCSQRGAWIRPIYKYQTRGCVIEVQHVASMGCRIAFEIEQVGVEEMLGDQLIYREGVYPVTFWEEGNGEDYQSWLEVEFWKRVPLQG